MQDAWQDYTALADHYNEPGRFTAIIGYECTTHGGYNLHRNVLFRGDASSPTRPCRSRSTTARIPKTCGRHLDEFEKRTGRGGAGHPAQRQPVATGACSPSRLSTASRSPRSSPRCARRWSRSSRSPRSRVTAKPIPCFRPTTSSPTTRPGTSPTSTAPRPRAATCCNTEYAREALKTGLELEKQTWRQPLQVRHGRQHRLHTSLATARGGELLRQALRRGARTAPLGARRDRGARSRFTILAGSRPPPATPASGRPRTPARRSSTP